MPEHIINSEERAARLTTIGELSARRTREPRTIAELMRRNALASSAVQGRVVIEAQHVFVGPHSRTSVVEAASRFQERDQEKETKPLLAEFHSRDFDEQPDTTEAWLRQQQHLLPPESELYVVDAKDLARSAEFFLEDCRPGGPVWLRDKVHTTAQIVVRFAGERQVLEIPLETVLAATGYVAYPKFSRPFLEPETLSAVQKVMKSWLACCVDGGVQESFQEYITGSTTDRYSRGGEIQAASRFVVYTVSLVEAIDGQTSDTRLSN